MAKRVARKIKRTGKSASQFKFTSTFEYIDMECIGTWRPDNLRVLWLRSHRRTQSIEVEWVCTEDRGPNGASGRAVFDPPIAAALIVTLYRDAKKGEFEEKEYKYYIENDGPGGKKILASFTCDMSDYAGIPTSRHALEMNFKPVSRKIRKCLLGITLESEFLKEGNANDDDMQSTFSAVEPGGDDMIFADELEDEEDDDDLDEASTLGKRVIDNQTNINETTDETKDGQVDQPTNQIDTPPESTDVIHEHPKETTPTNNEEPTTSNNPFDNEPKGAESFGKLLWLPEAEFVDYNDMSIGPQRVESSQLIALYFSAQWCPPCRRFLPKLTKFYSTLKENNKPFEIVYVSNDNSRDEMVQYMSEQQMPWVALSYGHKLVEKLRLDYKVRSIPLLVVVSRSGQLLDDNAKKTVEGAGSAAAAIKLFSKWLEKSGEKSSDVFEDEEEVKQKRTILGSIKKALSREVVDKDEELSTEQKSPKTRAKSVDEQRETAQSKVPKSNITSGNKEELLRQLQDKEDVVRQLEEVNMSLKHTNDDLNDEVRTLRASLQQANEELQSLRESDAQKKEADEKFNEYLKLQGWLFKRGIKGPTANKWRRRYFRLDQGSKLYYYKSQAEGTPQGFIDLLKVISVSEVSPAQQDKNNASFNIQCEGRTFQLQAYDEAEMRRWITAIDKLKDFYRKQEAETEKST